MSLTRYINNDTILSLNIPQYAQIFELQDLNNVDNKILVPSITSLDSISGRIHSEMHVYTFNGDYIGGAADNTLTINSETNSLFVDVREVFRLGNITKGSYKIVCNLIAPIFGRPDVADVDNKKWPVFVKEISPDRTEIKLTLNNPDYVIAFQDFQNYVSNITNIDLLNNLIVNFGENYIYKILNIKFDITDSNVVYIKLYKELDDNVIELDKAWFGVEVMDPYIDTVTLATEEIQSPVTKIRGANFDLDVDDYNSQSTIYKSWDDLLDTDSKTSQRLIDGIISGSDQVTLNIDYTNFENFVFYSSAKERINNFQEKMLMIEKYTADNSIYENSSGSNSSFTISNIESNTNRIDTIVSNFDPFERWLYHHDTGSLFTHGISGSLTPWPKYIDSNVYVQHDVTSSLAEDWYSASYETATIYDRNNQNSLWWTIPEHVLMDDNNSEYITFVNMVGHHFDVMYSYIHALTKIHEKDEHPERGPSGELLFNIAKSFGWNLQNTRQLSDLWLYKLGTDSTGSFIESSNLKVLPHEQQTQQVWRRIVNNLPYLLKTKGTKRSIKALMSIYGIPNSLMSIKEYGGPGLNSDTPIAIEDTFGYKLLTETGSYIKIPVDNQYVKPYGWGNGSWCGETGSGELKYRPPNTFEFRFSSIQSGSTDPIIVFANEDSNSNCQFYISLNSPEVYNDDVLISGSTNYGKVSLEYFENGVSIASGSSEYLPIFDNDLWNIRLYTDDVISTGSIDYSIQIAKLSDCLYGRVTHDDTFNVTFNTGSLSGDVYLGGAPSSLLTTINSDSNTGYTFNSDLYSGFIQSYKEYFTSFSDDTFYNHIRNPRAYNTDTVSGSFYSLYRYHPFGLDLQRWSHETELLFMSSSQPDQITFTPSPIEFVNFTGDQNDHYKSINETFYAHVPTLGGNVLQGEKIRLEDSELLYELSPDRRSEKSEFDTKPTDSNRLAIAFSTADQLNRDIYNHMGFEALDSWIGDPEFEFNTEYSTLRNKRNEYYQKYLQKNDINAFIRILSVYDYTFFEQIKQLVPGRADLISGILIEPSILDRSKVQISKLPTVSNPQWDDTIDLNITSQSGEFLDLNDTLSSTGSIGIEFSYDTGSIEFANTVDIIRDYNTGSILSPFVISGSDSIITKTYHGDITIIDAFNGTNGALQTIFEDNVGDCRYKRKVCHYDAYLIKNSLFENSVMDDLGFWFQSGSIQLVSESVEFLNVQTFRFQQGTRINVDSFVSQSIVTDSGSRYFLRLYAKPFNSGSTAIFSLIHNGAEIHTQEFTNNFSGSIEWVNEYRFQFIGTGDDSLILKAGGNDLVIYTAEVYEYLPEWQEQWYRVSYKCLGIPITCTYEPWYYQINECSAQNNSRFKGSKLVGPDINVDSPNTIDGGPVVEVRDSNPNSLFTGDQNSQGNLRLT